MILNFKPYSGTLTIINSKNCTENKKFLPKKTLSNEPGSGSGTKEISYLIETETAHTRFVRDRNYSVPKYINYSFLFFLSNTYL